MTTGADVFFILMGAIMVLAMHSGFAFLEVGSVRKKNQVNALVKILTDFAASTIAYFFIGYTVAYGVTFFAGAKTLTGAEGGLFAASGYDLVKFFFLVTFAAAIPAIISGGIAERAKFWPQLIATMVLVSLVYPLFEGMVWGTRLGFQEWMTATFGVAFHDFAGSVVAIPPSNIPFLALGAWVLSVGWFGFNVMSAQKLEAVSGLVAINSLLAMVGGIASSLVIGRNDPGFVHNGALAGLVAVCAGSDVMHPIGALAVGGIAGGLFVWAFNQCQYKWRIDDVLGVWPLHGLCGLTGGILAGVFGQEALGGMGGVSFAGQLVGTLIGAGFAFAAGALIYGALKMALGIRLDEEAEYRGADLSIHHIHAYPEDVAYPHHIDEMEPEERAAIRAASQVVRPAE